MPHVIDGVGPWPCAVKLLAILLLPSWWHFALQLVLTAAIHLSKALNRDTISITAKDYQSFPNTVGKAQSLNWERKLYEYTQIQAKLRSGRTIPAVSSTSKRHRRLEKLKGLRFPHYRECKRSVSRSENDPQWSIHQHFPSLCSNEGQYHTGVMQARPQVGPSEL